MPAMGRLVSSVIKHKSRKRPQADFKFSAAARRRLESLLSNLSVRQRHEFLDLIERQLTIFHFQNTQKLPNAAEIRTVFTALIEESKSLRQAIEETPFPYFCLPETLELWLDHDTRQQALAAHQSLPPTIVEYLRNFEGALNNALTKWGTRESRGRPKQSNKRLLVWKIYYLLSTLAADDEKIEQFVHGALKAARVIEPKDDEDELDAVRRLIRGAREVYE